MKPGRRYTEFTGHSGCEGIVRSIECGQVAGCSSAVTECLRDVILMYNPTNNLWGVLPSGLIRGNKTAMPSYSRKEHASVVAYAVLSRLGFFR